MSEPESIVPITPKPYPGFAQALLVLLLYQLFSLLSVPGIVLGEHHHSQLGSWVFLAGQLGATALALKVCLGMGGKPWAAAFPTRAVPAGVWPAVLVVTGGLVMLLNGIGNWVSHLIPPTPSFEHMFGTLGWPPIVLGAPITEEPIFRGLILGGFVHRYGIPKGILYGALLFGAFHMNPWQLPTGIVLGLFLGWLVVHTSSLWPGVFGHLLNNLSAVLADKLGVRYLSDNHFQPFWMWTLGFALTGLGLWALSRITSDMTAPDEEAMAAD